MSVSKSAGRPALISIDQGTTSSRTIAFSDNGEIIASAQQEFPQIYPKDGWVEHDPEDIWNSVLSTLKDVFGQIKNAGYSPLAIGITNQRETTLVWDKKTGKPIYNAIVWQDRRTAAQCALLAEKLNATELNAKTGLLHDPYFSATKIAWILDHVDGARAQAEAGKLAFGTVDTFLIFRLTGGQVHASDATNASRTNIFNIRTQTWDPELLELFDVPAEILPQVRNSADDYGRSLAEYTGTEIPIFGVAGDQQAAAIGQCCFAPGDIKSTYGTGCFVLMNTGRDIVSSSSNLLSTIAYRLDDHVTYAQEGSIFIAGAAVQWLRDEVGLIDTAASSEALAKESQDNDNLYLVPAFTGLGAPYWDPDARGALIGITRDTNNKDIVRATLESICYQTHDLIQALAGDGMIPKSLKVDGGMVQNDWVLQRLSDIVNLPVDRPVIMETTALGVAYLAGLKAGLFSSLDDISGRWKLDAQYAPKMTESERNRRIAGWSTAVERVITRS